MTTHRPLPLVLWLPTLAVGVALFLVFVWPTLYWYEAHPQMIRGGETYPGFTFRTNRFTGDREYRLAAGGGWEKPEAGFVILEPNPVRLFLGSLNR